MKYSAFLSFLLIALSLMSCKEEIPNYTVIVNSSPPEGGSVSPQGGEYQLGQTAIFTATPNEFYEFIGWSGADAGTINPLSLIVDTNKSLTARFDKLDTDNDGVTDDFDQCPYTPEGQEADNNGCSLSQKDFELSISIEGEGTVAEEIVVAPTVYKGTTQVRLTAVPSEGWELTEWDGDATGSENPIIIVIDGPKNITAEFTKKDTDGDGVPDLDDQDNNTREGVPVDEFGVMLNPVYLDDNGVTIKAQEWGIVGDIGKIGEKDIRIVGDEELQNLVQSNGDYTNICTSFVNSIRALFNQKENISDISSWDVSNVTNMSFAFSNSEFNGDISSWDVSNVEDMGAMFENSPFNGDISNWNVHKVRILNTMFYNSEFNGDISGWNVSNAKEMDGMFSGNTSFNQDISGWDVRSVWKMGNMFSNSVFNQDISSWELTSIVYMGNMFSNSLFNQDVSSWDVSNAAVMAGMFADNKVFNQDLSNWDVSNVTQCGNFSAYASNWTLPKPNFSKCNPN